MDKNLTTKGLTGNNGTAFFAVILAMLIFGGLGITTVSLLSNERTAFTDNLQGTQTFYVAEGGMHHTIMSEFFRDGDFSDNLSPTDPPFGANSISLNPGEFWVEYSNQTPSSVDVKVTGRADNTVRVITQTLTNNYQYVTLAGRNITAQTSSGNFSGDIGLQGNMNMDQAIVVNGGVIQSPNLNLPTMDLQVYKDMTTETFLGTKVFSADYTGNLHVVGDVNFVASMTYNGLLYVDGTVNIVTDNLTFNGTLVVEGDINAPPRDSLTFIAQPIDATSHMPAIVCLGDVSFNSTTNLNIYGLVWTTGDINFGDSINLNHDGSLIASNDVLFNNATNLSLTFNTQLITGIPGLLNLSQTVKTISLSNWKLN